MMEYEQYDGKVVINEQMYGKLDTRLPFSDTQSVHKSRPVNTWA